MGRDCAAAIADRLIVEGRSPDTPALAVENAGRPDARLMKGDLATLPSLIAAAAPQGPVVMVIGAVALRAYDQPSFAIEPARASRA
jgi:uroporphyrin-III C-methyltransferase